MLRLIQEAFIPSFIPTRRSKTDKLIVKLKITDPTPGAPPLVSLGLPVSLCITNLDEGFALPSVQASIDSDVSGKENRRVRRPSSISRRLTTA